MSSEQNKINRVTIMDIDFVNITKQELLTKHIYPRLQIQDKFFIATPNPEIVMRTREDQHYKKVIQSADYIVPDGAGIVLSSRYIKNPILERIPGFELMVDLLEYANDNGLSCYFLGARDYINNRLIEVINKRYEHIKIAGNHHGYFEDGEEIANNASETNPDIVFVALGSPKQEEWIYNYIDKFSKGLFIGVGGSFDILAGELKRAPKSWIKHNLEWLYRLLKEPFRWKRILKSVEFMVRMRLRGK
ncbi:WecB/TagA/CpsF family glycosyltransferase [Ornithinibacillus sp. 179-J 7C1 HS]|uniref:WecB/TagA/CpsF family glycosyltransferase n=1 Tax=Ornithinibacillus sp. 179-J 7C1 HS TaxID=3142384 RepID=UPI0039A3B77F